MHATLPTRAAFGVVALTAIVVFLASAQTPMASAWSWNEDTVKLNLTDHKRSCAERELELAPGWYDVQEYVDQVDWDDRPKWGATRKRAVLVKRRGKYTWNSCTSFFHFAYPYQRDGYSFWYGVEVETFFAPTRGGGGIDVDIVDDEDGVATMFPTNSKPDTTFMAGSRIYRTRLLPG